jgi:hypothetical protein
MSYKFFISATTLDDKVFGNIRNVAIANAFRNIGNHFQGVAIGSISESVILNSGPTYGAGVVTITSGNVSADDTITIAGVVLTAKATPTGTAQFLVGSTALQTGISLAAVINANPTLHGLVTASYAKSSTSALITVTAKASGTAGNLTWSESLTNGTILPASALGGGANGPVAAAATVTISATGPTNGQTMTILNTTFTAKTSGAVAANAEFNISATAATVAASLVSAINATAATKNAVVATNALGVVTVTSLVPGTLGNGFQIDIGSLSNSVLVAFAGGTDANVLTLHKGL